MAIFIGLAQHHVSALKATWNVSSTALHHFNLQVVPESYHKKWAEIQALGSPPFAQLRPLHDNSSLAVKTPGESTDVLANFAVMFVHDITMLDQGNENWVNKENQIINLEKLLLLGTPENVQNSLNRKTNDKYFPHTRTELQFRKGACLAKILDKFAHVRI